MHESQPTEHLKMSDDATTPAYGIAELLPPDKSDTEKLNYLYDLLRRFEITQAGVMPKLHVRVRLLPHAVCLPKYAHVGDAGADLYAAVREPVWIESGEHAAIPTGVCIQIPPGYEAQVRGRSGLALKAGIGITQGVGTIDSTYRGEIMVLLHNQGPHAFQVVRGDRVAQLILTNVFHGDFKLTQDLSETARGEGGFGSTGMRE